MTYFFCRCFSYVTTAERYRQTERRMDNGIKQCRPRAVSACCVVLAWKLRTFRVKAIRTEYWLKSYILVLFVRADKFHCEHRWCMCNVCELPSKSTFVFKKKIMCLKAAAVSVVSTFSASIGSTHEGEHRVCYLFRVGHLNPARVRSTVGQVIKKHCAEFSAASGVRAWPSWGSIWLKKNTNRSQV